MINFRLRTYFLDHFCGVADEWHRICIVLS